LGDTYQRQGFRAAGTVGLRMVRRKIPLIWNQLVTRGQVRQVRQRLRDAAAADTALSTSTGPGRAPRIAVVITGGVGDMIVIARFLRDLGLAAGDLVFDVFCSSPTTAAWALAAVPGVDQTYHDILFEPLAADYDVALRVNQMIVVFRETIRWPVLKDRPVLTRVLAHLIRTRGDVDVFVERHPFLDHYLARSSVFAERTRRDFLHHLAGIPYTGDLLPVPASDAALAREGLSPRGYVTVHNGFDPSFVISGTRATKCYPHFDAVVRILKRALPSMTFVQVGTRTSEALPACDVQLIDRTTLPEVAGLLRGAAFHIDNEGGLVHLARCYGVVSGVVFGPTPSDYFAYPDNVTIDPPVCGNCWWQTRTWMDACAKGYGTPRCMTEQDPAEVARRVLEAMRAQGVTDDARPRPVAAIA
jgi:ADP-heptose:LPS heptosyltransferase